MKFPCGAKPIHFIGIGGIGMSGIAELLHDLHYTVQGSDLNESQNVARLREKGVPIWIGHEPSHLDNASLVVVSSAIKRDNSELLAARARGLPVVSRSEILAEIARWKGTIAVAGTHGKTTTVSLIAALLVQGGVDPTVINGGIINAYGSNIRLGAGDWMVVEADESDGGFITLPVDVSVITNIDPEHLNHYGCFDALRSAFREFVNGTSSYGFALLCSDHAEVRAIAESTEHVRVLTYGENRLADIRLQNVRTGEDGVCFDVIRHDKRIGIQEIYKDLRFFLPGKHNALDAVAALAVAREFGVSTSAIRVALAEFRGVDRRFTRICSWKGIQIFDDYAHHPVEIEATLRASRALCTGRVIVVVQPHRYSRLRHLFTDFVRCFHHADIAIIAPVYSGGEEAIEGFGQTELVEELRGSGHPFVIMLRDRSQLSSLLMSLGAPGDCVVLCGAGDISQWARALPEELRALSVALGSASAE